MSQKWLTSVIVSSLTALFFLLEPTNSETIGFIIEPAVGTISLHQMLNVTLQCRLNSTESGHSYKPSWALNFPDTNPEHYLSTNDDNDKAKLAEHGVRYYSNKNSTNITIPGFVKNNRTLVLCKTFYHGETQFSDEIRLIIAGPPLSPDPTLNVLSPSQLKIQWDIPFSHESDPIQRYDIQILNTSSGRKFEYNVSQNGYTFPTEDGNKAEHCHHLMFNVTAVSAQGQSKPGKVSGGFPVAPKPFSSEIDVAVTFYGNGTPIAKVSFEAPFICDYQTSNYVITIENATAVPGSPSLIHQSTYTGRSRMITETFDTGLHANNTYTLTVTVRDSIFVDDVSTAINFSTPLHPAPPSSQDVSSGLQVRDIGIFTGGGFSILLTMIMIIIILIACSKKRKLKKAPGSTMDLMLNSINRSRATGQRSGSQYDTPSKSAHGSGLYETIDGYQKQTPAHCKATMFSWQQQEYLWKLQQQPNFESDRSGDVIEADIPYQEMHSASEQGVAGVYNPSHIMMHQGPQKPNNSQKSYAVQVESSASAAAVGSTTVTSPIRMTDSDSDTDFNHSQSFGDHLSTTAVVNESVGTTESEYTFMSQAGTLAGQQSKLTLCTNGCVNVEDPEAHSHSNVDAISN